MSDKLKPCPFCGSSAHIERVGDRRQSTIYQCDNCSCSLETGEEWDHGRDWNRRAPSTLEAELEKAREAALEEAAKVAEAASAEWDSDVELWIKDGMPNTAKASMHHSKAALLVAAAIRALSQDKEARE